VGSGDGGDDSGSGSWKELRTSRNPGAEEQTTVSRKRKVENSGATAAANNGGNNGEIEGGFRVRCARISRNRI
ncbi:hypothetical protein U1Q18_000717, partial [Sarracenia purpurea var. burkii]